MAKGALKVVNTSHLLARDITRRYQDQAGASLVALEHFQLEVAAGEIVSLVGPSGCGKSTFLRLVAGLDFPQEGEILYNGVPVTGPHYERGFVFQDANLFPWLNVYDNIAFGLRSRGVYRQQKQQVQEYIELVGLAGFEKAYPHQISGGMAGRASLARTFIQHPHLILLDEPLGALDTFTRGALQEEILKIWRQDCPIILLVTHDIEEAVFLSDRVVVMSPRPGRVLREVEIPLPHPRNRTGEDFMDLRRRIMAAMDAE